MDTIDVEILATVVNNGTGDFDELTNRPKYNGAAMTHETNVPEVKTAAWDAKYVKPVDGIPSSDMTEAVQTSLGKADTALQSHQSLAAYRTASAQDAIDTGLSNAIATKYSKPSTGIPKTDMSSDIQTSLGKADSALQEHQSLSAYRTASAQDTIDATKASASALSEHTGNTNNPHGVTSEQVTYDGTAQSHTSGSVGAALASQSEQIVTLASGLTNKAATAADEGKFAKVKKVENGSVTEWEFGEGGGGGDTAGVVAPAYSASSTYSKGALVIYNQLLYEANADISTAEAWTVMHWTQTTVDAVFDKYQKYGNITVSCVDAQAAQIAGVMITVKSQVDGTVFGTYQYNGSPISVRTPYGYSYKLEASYKSGYVTPAPIFGTGTATATATFTYKTGIVYGFHISNTEADPAAKVTYIQGTDSYDMTPAHMDFQNDEFNYGSWENAFFMPKPCMLKYDGTVDYYLDPDDYTKRSDGVTASDITDTTYGGNAMMEWGQNGQKIWYKVVPDDGDDYSASVYISNEQADSDYVAWSFIDAHNNAIDHFYTPIYNGANVSNKLRSMSGIAPWNTTGGASNEITAAKANNVTTDIEWYTEVEADVQLINFLLTLMARTTQTQGAYGYGHHTGVSSASNLIISGTMNTKGMFWGSDQTGLGVKVFGMENWWGNIWRRYGGHIDLNNTQKFKMTCGTADGSTAQEYNIDGTGYITVGEAITGNSGGYITKMKFLPKYGMFQVKLDASASTQYCDGVYFASGTAYAVRGGACSDGLVCGAFALNLNNPASASGWNRGAAPSCKPLASV